MTTASDTSKTVILIRPRAPRIRLPIPSPRSNIPYGTSLPRSDRGGTFRPAREPRRARIFDGVPYRTNELGHGGSYALFPLEGSVRPGSGANSEAPDERDRCGSSSRILAYRRETSDVRKCSSRIDTRPGDAGVFPWCSGQTAPGLSSSPRHNPSDAPVMTTPTTTMIAAEAAADSEMQDDGPRQPGPESVSTRNDHDPIPPARLRAQLKKTGQSEPKASPVQRDRTQQQHQRGRTRRLSPATRARERAEVRPC